MNKKFHTFVFAAAFIMNTGVCSAAKFQTWYLTACAAIYCLVPHYSPVPVEHDEIKDAIAAEMNRGTLRAAIIKARKGNEAILNLVTAKSVQPLKIELQIDQSGSEGNFSWEGKKLYSFSLDGSYRDIYLETNRVATVANEIATEIRDLEISLSTESLLPKVSISNWRWWGVDKNMSLGFGIFTFGFMIYQDNRKLAKEEAERQRKQSLNSSGKRRRK